LDEREKVEAAAREEGRRDGIQVSGSEGVFRIAAERRRQIEAEGWTPAHDDTHKDGEMARAAAAYALSSYGSIRGYELFPWSSEWWKPRTPLEDLARAGALIAAEIDRLLRAARPEGGA
jgi:hypothetical protein